MKEILEKKGFICDMDGVIYHGNEILDGVAEFVNWMIEHDKKFVFLTNSPERTPHELSMKLERMGLNLSRLGRIWSRRPWVQPFHRSITRL